MTYTTEQVEAATLVLLNHVHGSTGENWVAAREMTFSEWKTRMELALASLGDQ